MGRDWSFPLATSHLPMMSAACAHLQQQECLRLGCWEPGVLRAGVHKAGPGPSVSLPELALGGFACY